MTDQAKHEEKKVRVTVPFTIPKETICARALLVFREIRAALLIFFDLNDPHIFPIPQSQSADDVSLDTHTTFFTLSALECALLHAKKWVRQGDLFLRYIKKHRWGKTGRKDVSFVDIAYQENTGRISIQEIRRLRRLAIELARNCRTPIGRVLSTA